MTQLMNIRKGFKNPTVSQENLARLSDVTLSTYRKAEKGGAVRFATAQSILQGLNTELRKRGQQEVGLFDLGLHIE